MEKKEKISIDLAKDERLYRTDVLDEYKGGWMMELENISKEGEIRKTYIVKRNNEIYIFKSIVCSVFNTKGINQAKSEYELSLQCANLSQDVPKLLKHKELAIESLDKYFIELVYEYYGKNLYSVLGQLDGKAIVDIMRKTLTPLLIMELNGISHSNINPANIVLDGENVKILNFDLSLTFNEKTELIKEGKLTDDDLLYYPPEIIRSEKYSLNKVDVYCWGMTFYQIIAEKSNSELKEELNLRLTDHKKFIKNLRNIQIKGDDKKIRDWIVEIISKTIVLNTFKRPTFKELAEIMLNKEYYKKEYDRIEEALIDTIRERGI